MSTDGPQVSYVFKPHNQAGVAKRDRAALEELMNTPPQKTIACQRCRKLRKKCSKHSPKCITCTRMGQDCVYADEGDTQYKASPPLANAPAPAPPTLLPPLQNDWSNYTHRTTHMDRAPSLPSLIHSHNDGLTRLPSIKLPSINTAQLATIPTEPKPLSQRKHRASGPTEIQSALLSTIISLGKQNLQPSFQDAKPLMLPREVAVNCINAFFAQCDPLYPFIHKQSFLTKFESMNLFNTLNPGPGVSEREKKNCFQVYLMLSVGFHDLERLGPSSELSKDEIKAHSWVFSADSVVSWLNQGVLSLRSYEDIVCMVLLVLDSFHQRNCLATTNLTNILTGLVLRYHYHRKLGPREIQKVYKDDTWSLELRYRLFWTVYVLDRTISIYLNKPIALPDSIITTPYPLQTHNDPQNSSTSLTMLLSLKRLEGDIFQSVHTVTALNSHTSTHNDEHILNPLRKRIEQWYLTTTSFQDSNTDVLWLTTMYYNALTLVYRPSYLVPHPTRELLERLTRAVTQNLTYTYNLNKRGRMNWLEMFRVLVVFKTLLKCFAEGCLAVGESRTELNLCVEITKSYRGDEGEDWAFLDDVALVFQRLLKLVFEEVKEDVLVREARFAEERLEAILVEHSIGCRLDDRIAEEYGV